MKHGISSDPFQCKPEIAFFKVSFLFQMTYLGVLNMEISKSAVSLANEHLSGIPFLFPIILLSEISQPDYVHLNTCNNVQIIHPNGNIDETWYFV